MSNKHTKGKPFELRLYYSGATRSLTAEAELNTESANGLSNLELLEYAEHELRKFVDQELFTGHATAKYRRRVSLPIGSKNGAVSAAFEETPKTVKAIITTPKRTYSKRFASSLYCNWHSAREWAVTEIERYDEAVEQSKTNPVCDY